MWMRHQQSRRHPLSYKRGHWQQLLGAWDCKVVAASTSPNWAALLLSVTNCPPSRRFAIPMRETPSLPIPPAHAPTPHTSHTHAHTQAHRHHSHHHSTNCFLTYLHSAFTLTHRSALFVTTSCHEGPGSPPPPTRTQHIITNTHHDCKDTAVCRQLPCATHITPL